MMGEKFCPECGSINVFPYGISFGWKCGDCGFVAQAMPERESVSEEKNDD